MKKILSALLFMVIVLSACSQQSAPTWQEQYDLGIRYLSERSYEEAIIAFNAAIEIDPKRPEAYKGAADAYEALGDTESLMSILKQGVEATGNNELLERLEQLTNQQNAVSDTVEETSTGEPGSVVGTLSISNFEYSFVDGGFYSEHNEGAIGGMNLRFTVNGPTDVTDVWIWTWSPDGFSASEIPTLIAEATEIWKSEVGNEEFNNELPFESNIGFPVWSDDHNSTVDVLLIGIDKNIDAVGYAIVTVSIP